MNLFKLCIIAYLTLLFPAIMLAMEKKNDNHQGQLSSLAKKAKPSEDLMKKVRAAGTSCLSCFIASSNENDSSDSDSDSDSDDDSSPDGKRLTWNNQKKN